MYGFYQYILIGRKAPDSDYTGGAEDDPLRLMTRIPLKARRAPTRSRS